MSRAELRIVSLALAGGVLVDLVIPGNAAGVNAPIVTAAFLGAGCLAAGGDGLRRMDPADAWLPVAALVLASMAAVRADGWLVAWDLAFAAALAAATIGCLAGGRVTRGVLPRVLELSVGVGVAGLAGASGVLRPGATGDAAPVVDGAGDGGDRRVALRVRLAAGLRRAAPVLRGLAISVPVVAVFALLFASADAVFARLATNALAWHPDVDPWDLAQRSLVVGVVAWVAAGALGLAAGMLPALGPDLPLTGPPFGRLPANRGTAPVPGSRAVPGAPAGRSAAAATSRDDPALPPRPPAPAQPWGAAWGATSATWPTSPGSLPARSVALRTLRLGSAEAATVVVVVDLLFATFVALQLAYLFGGHDTMALAGMTYADYARRGFFELVLVAALAGGLVVTLDVAAGPRTRARLAASLVLLALTAVVLVSALVRLRLYQAAYGWTELRFVVLVAIGWLAVALAVTAGLLLARRTPWILHALGIMVLVTIVAMNVVGPQAFVAERNLERAIDPSLVPPGGRTGIDAAYLEQLGDEAVVPVTAAWDRLGPAERVAIGPALARRARVLAGDPDVRGWPSWNLTRERARQALRAWEAAGGR